MLRSIVSRLTRRGPASPGPVGPGVGRPRPGMGGSAAGGPRRAQDEAIGRGVRGLLARLRR